MTAKNLYNQDIKERFIDTMTSTMKPNCITVFKAVKPIEELLNKDIYNFEKEDIDLLYSYLNKKSVNALMMINNIIKRYMEWAVTQDIIKDYDHYVDGLKQLSLSRFCSAAIERQTIIDRETIINWTKQLRDKMDYYNPRDSFLMLAPFEGINGYLMSDVINIQWKDFSKKEDQYYAVIRNRTIEISKELYEIAKESRFTNKYCGGVNRHGTLTYYPLEENDNIVRLTQSKKSKTFTYLNARNHVIKVLKMVDADHITIKNIENNGIIYMVKKKIEEHNMTLINYLWSQYFIDEVCNQFDLNVSSIDCIRNQVKMVKNLFGI